MRGGVKAGVSGKIEGVHIEGDGDVVGDGGAVEDGLDVACEGAGVWGSDDDLEAELAVGAGEWGGDDFAEDAAVGEVLLEAEVEGLEGEFRAAFVAGACGEDGAVAEGREGELAAEFHFLF